MIQSISPGDMQTTKLTPLHFYCGNKNGVDVVDVEKAFSTSTTSFFFLIKTDFYHGATMEYNVSKSILWILGKFDPVNSTIVVLMYKDSKANIFKAFFLLNGESNQTEQNSEREMFRWLVSTISSALHPLFVKLHKVDSHWSCVTSWISLPRQINTKYGSQGVFRLNNSTLCHCSVPDTFYLWWVSCGTTVVLWRLQVQTFAIKMAKCWARYWMLNCSWSCIITVRVDV